MSASFVFAGADMPDVASVDHASGITYRCYVYRRQRKRAIEATIVVEQEDGQNVVLDQGTVRTVEFEGPDCPRVIGRSGRYFVAYWIEPLEDGSVAIGRAVFDVEDHASGWQFRGFTTGVNFQSRLYDAVPVAGHNGDIVVVHHRQADPDEVQVIRFEPPWSDAHRDWSDTYDLTDIRPRVLGCAATDVQDTIVVSWVRDTEGELDPDTGQPITDPTRGLWTFRVDASDGGNYAEAETFGDLPDDSVIVSPTKGNDFMVVGHCHLEPGANQWCVVTEWKGMGLVGNERVSLLRRAVASRRISGNDATPIGSSQWDWNLHLVSRPWTWRTAYSSTVNVYCVLSYKNHRSATAGPANTVPIDDQWGQAFGFVVDLGRADWIGAGPGVVHPKPIAALMSGSFDARPTGHSPAGDSAAPTDLENTAGTKRMNHLSHVSGPPQYALGPDRKTVTVATLAWSRLMTARRFGFGIGAVSEANAAVSILPIQSSVRGLRVYHEDPWMMARDPKEAALPSGRNYQGAHHRPIALPTETAGGLIFSGGVTQSFAGTQLVELGFFWRPEILGVRDGASVDPERSWWYTATYVWVDEQGQLHRSGPATPMRLGVANSADFELEIAVRTMTLSMKGDTLRYPRSGPINIELWRTYIPKGTTDEALTQVGTLLFRRVYSGQASDVDHQLSDTPVNDRSDWFQVIRDSMGDEFVETADILPWQLDLNAMQWTPSPPIPHVPLSVVATWNNRLWGVSPEDPRVIVYSNEILPLGTQYVMPEFIDENTFRFDSRGEITALQPMDAELFVFTRDAIYALSGDGNSALGDGSNLILEVVAEGTGCIEPRSVVLGPPGIFFQSAKGYYILSRGKELDYVSAGAAIEDLIREGGNVRGAELLEDRHQIRLALNRIPGSENTEIYPTVAIYDYFHRMWSTIEVPHLQAPGSSPRRNEMQSSTFWRGIEGETCHVLLQQGGLAVERAKRDTVFADGSHSGTVAIPLDITVEWIHLAGIMGYKKLHAIGVQLDRVNTGPIKVDLWYDRNGDYLEGAPDDSFTGNPERGYLRIRPSIRKCTAVLIRIYETGSVPLTQNLKITGITLDVGMKRGPRRVPDNQVGA